MNIIKTHLILHFSTCNYSQKFILYNTTHSNYMKREILLTKPVISLKHRLLIARITETSVLWDC